MVLSLASILAESAARYPSKPALAVGPAKITYAELWEQARRYGAALESLGIAPDDRVAIMIPNVPDFPRAYYGILAAGGVVVPVHALLTAEEVAYVLRDSGAKLLLCAGPLLASGGPGAAAAGVPCYSLMADAAGEVPRFEDVAARRGASGQLSIEAAARRCRHSVYQRDDWIAERRAADPEQPRSQRDDRRLRTLPLRPG